MLRILSFCYSKCNRVEVLEILETSLVRPAIFLLITLTLLAGSLAAQQTASPAQQTPSPAAAPESSAASQPPPTAQRPAGQSKDNPVGKGDDQAKGTSGTTSATSKDRLFYALPNFLTLENSGHVPPLTAGQKFKVVARSSFDPVQYFWYGFLAGISQAQNSEPGFGQGAEGYGKRYGSAFADGTIENFMTAAVLPSLLHQDPRFFQSGQGGFGRRTGYAVSRIFVTRTDSGHQQFNFSEILGSAASASISTYSYHPSGDRTFGNTMSVWGSQVGYDTVTIVIKEFWPDIRRKLRKK
jgi:hypothetical protein